MTTVLDSDTAILRLSELRGIPYEEARLMVQRGEVSFSVSISDSNLAVTANLSGDSGSYLAPLNGSSKTRTAVTYGTINTLAADTAETFYTVSTGKTLYVTGLLVRIAGGSLVYFRLGVALSGTTNGDGNGGSNEIATGFNGSNPVYIDCKGLLTFSSAAVIQIMADANANCSVTLFGWEE